MRLVIDRITGQKADKDTLYRAADGKYYTSLEAYENMAREKREREKCIESISAFLEYPEGAKLPGITYKKLKELETFGYSSVFDVICNKAKAIEWAMQNKEFSNDASRVMYIFGIIRNNIGDTYRQNKLASNKTTNVSEEYLAGEVTNTNARQKVRDITRFLEEVDD